MQKAAFFSAASALLALALSPAGVRWLHGLLAARSPPLSDDAVADVAIVLGYALFRNGSLTEPLKGRVRAGVEAFQQGRARHLLFSGSHPGGAVAQRTEANVMREYAEQVMAAQGAVVPPDRWFEEDASTSTFENALFSLDICRRKGWKTLLVVTSPFHQLRSELVFHRLVSRASTAEAAKAKHDSDAGHGPMEVYMARAEVVPHAGYFSAVASSLVDVWDWARELLALVYYLAKGRL